MKVFTVMQKSNLRKDFLTRRKQLSSEQIEAYSQEIATAFFHFFDISSLRSIHIFLPISAQNEINTRLIVHKLFQTYPSVQVVVPRSNFDTCTMQSFLLTSSTALQENRWGIPEPVKAISFPDQQIDMVLLPLLCIDHQGYRVGYGKGFYDRFLQQCKPDVLKVGLALFNPVEKIQDLHSQDVPLDYCIIRQKVMKF